jgi:adenosylhomocysteine nucleosidase
LTGWEAGCAWQRVRSSHRESWLMQVGIIAALKEEIEPLVQSLEGVETSKWGRRSVHERRIGDNQVVALAGGVGKVKAAACTQYLIDRFSIEALICTGVAGAINPRLHTGDVVVSQKTLQHDFDPGDPKLLKRFRKRWLEADAELVKLALEAAKEVGLADRCRSGKVLTGDQAIVSQERRESLWKTFRGDCVDMESAAVAQVCRLNGVPWVIVRAISDSAEEDSVAEFRRNLREAAGTAARVAGRMVESIRPG